MVRHCSGLIPAGLQWGSWAMFEGRERTPERAVASLSSGFRRRIVCVGESNFTLRKPSIFTTENGKYASSVRIQRTAASVSLM